jgi:hypothetical protein
MRTKSPDEMFQRMHDLAQLLSPSIPKPEHFRLLECIEFFDEGNKFILVFKVPRTAPASSIHPQTAPSMNIPDQQTKVFPLLRLLNNQLTEIGIADSPFSPSPYGRNFNACLWVGAQRYQQRAHYLLWKRRSLSTHTSKSDSPYISGFSYSRPDKSRAFSDLKNSKSLYLHPQYLKDRKR